MNPTVAFLPALALFFLLPGLGHSREKVTAQQERMKACNAQA